MSKLGLEDFLSRFEVNVKTLCWEWVGPFRGGLYGDFQGQGAHRKAFELWEGPIPEGRLVCHTCDNPPCVNPDHLFVGTYSDNALDAHAKGRLKGRPTRGGHLLTPTKVLEIRAAQGVRQIDLAARYGVSRSMISHIRTGRNWKNVV